MPIKGPSPDNLQQLALELDLPAPDTPEGMTPEQVALRLEAARTTWEDRDTPPRWYDEYAELRAAGWPFRVACYIAWAASPRKERWPWTLDGLATEVLGLTSARQVYKWRQGNPVIDETVKVVQAKPLFASRRAIYDALIEVATDPDYKGHSDRKLALEMLGDYVPRSKVVNDVRLVGISADDMADAQTEMGDIEAALMGEGDAPPGEDVDD